MRLIIAGTRSFNDYDLLKQKVSSILANITEPVEIVSGNCKGADLLGEQYAKEFNYPV